MCLLVNVNIQDSSSIHTARSQIGVGCQSPADAANHANLLVLDLYWPEALLSERSQPVHPSPMRGNVVRIRLCFAEELISRAISGDSLSDLGSYRLIL